MRKLILITCLVAIAFPALAQNWREADSLQKALGRTGTDTGRANILVKLAEFEIFKPGELKSDLDSGAMYLDQAKIINKKLSSDLVYAHIAIAESHLDKERKQFTEGRVSAEKAIQIFQKRADKYQMGQAYFVLSECYNYLDAGELSKKIQIVKQAANIFKQGGYIEREAYCYKVIAELDPTPAQTFEDAKVALALYQSIHSTQLQAVYDVVGSSYFYLGDYGKALTYYLKALSSAKTSRDTTMQLCEINNHVGLVYFQLYDYKQAVKYFEAALVTAKVFKDAPTVFLLTGNIANCYLKLNKSREALKITKSTLNEYPLPANAYETDSRFAVQILRAYLNLKRFDLAKPYSDHLLSLINNDRITKHAQGDSYLDLVRYFFASKQYPEMLSCLTKGDILSRKLGYPLNVEIIHSMWFSLDTAQNNYEDAVKHLLIARAISDSMFTQKKAQQIQQLQVQFDTKQKEDQIKILNQKGELDQSNLKRATLERNVTVGAIALVLIIAALLYRQSKLRKMSNSIITHKNTQLQSLVTEKEWLLKEVHHRVKNNLHSVISLLEAQSAYLKDDALKAIENSQHRIYTMSLIHQKLYQAEDIKTIDMIVYIPELVQYLRDSFVVSGRIHFQTAIDPVQLNPAQAIPLALIINEALTNSIKYAFPNGRRGEIAISLTDSGVSYTLEIADNGIGMNKKAMSPDKGSLGLELIKGLAKEIRGEITINSGNGVRIVIVFDHDLLPSMDQLRVDYSVSA